MEYISVFCVSIYQVAHANHNRSTGGTQMSDILVLRARLRKRDKDIKQAVSNLKLEEGEIADMVRDGFRMKLTEIGAMRPPASPITPDTAQLIARELMNNLKAEKAKEKEPGKPNSGG